ncbi:MAG: methyl-accepting chemotaxis protein [Oscillospiraceae bacterium]|jgi:methyl-accepting chemotaxis protein|nr:methyl-accepting chemotaxis protein [Oscillospiraceae bacterium]
MKNMKVAQKLIVSFLIVALMTGIVGVVGIIGMSQISSGQSEMYDMQTLPMPYMTKIIEMLQRQRAALRDMIIGSALGDMPMIENAKKQADEYHAELVANLDPYRASIVNPDAFAIFDEAVRLYNTDFMECKNGLYNMARGNATEREAYTFLGQYTQITQDIVTNFDKVLQMKVASASNMNTEGDNLFRSLLILIIIVLVLAVASALGLAFYISGLISKPLGLLTTFMKRAGGTGDITLGAEDERTIGQYGQMKDEVGQCIGATAAFIGHVIGISKLLEHIADGDLRDEVKLLSATDTLGVSLTKTLQNLNGMFGEINSSTAQVSTGSKQIADGSQSLAQGSTEQAAAVEQLSSSISEIAQKTKANAEMAARAATLATTIMTNAETGSRQMDEMMSAVKDINQASQSISKVIKAIDDIAFQTNILALNAAVEAARAGQHGKGFAVVAEEVRNLASKSAEAAKETGGLIANSIEKAELGARIADETAASLAEIVTGINESTQLVSEIASSSEEQSEGILQINRGIDQVAQVVQQNSATAEESAAASEEMNGQASLLEDLIAQFKLKEGQMQRKAVAAPAQRKQITMPEKTAYAPTESGEYGKY